MLGTSTQCIYLAAIPLAINNVPVLNMAMFDEGCVFNDRIIINNNRAACIKLHAFLKYNNPKAALKYN